MDFHSMKRKELQALCKKHSIPANLTNLEMANKLTSLLKENEKPKTRGPSCLKGSDEIVNASDSDVVSRPLKKVKFSPENELFEYSKSDPREKGRMTRRNSRLRPDEIQDLLVENIDRFESNEEIVENPVRVKRSRAHSSVEVGLVSVTNSPVEKKRGRRPVKKVVDLYDDSVAEEIKLPTRRLLRNREVVESGVVSIENRVVNRGRKRGIDRSDEPKSSAAVLPEDSAAEEVEPRLPMGRSLRDRKVVGNGKEGAEDGADNGKNMKKRTLKRIAKGSDEVSEKEAIVTDGVINEPEKVLTRSRRNGKKGKESELLSGDLDKVEIVGRQKITRSRAQKTAAVDSETNVDTDIEVAEVVLHVDEPLRRTSRNRNRRKSVVSPALNEDEVERNGTKVKESETVNGDFGQVEMVGRRKTTRSRARLGAKVSAMDSETRIETEVQGEAEVLHIEEQLRRTSRNNNRRKSVMHQVLNEDKVEAVSVGVPLLEEPLRRPVRNSNRRKSVMPQAINEDKVGGPQLEDPLRHPVRNVNRRKSVLPQVEKVEAVSVGVPLLEEPLRRLVRNSNRMKSVMPQAINEDKVGGPQLEDPLRHPVRNVNRRKSVLPQVEKVKADGLSAKYNRRSCARKQVSFEDEKVDMMVNSVEMSASKSVSLQTENRVQEMDISVGDSVVKEKLNMSPKVDIEKSVQDYATKGGEDNLASYSPQKTGEFGSNGSVGRETVKDLNVTGDARFALANSVSDCPLDQPDSIVKLKNIQTEDENAHKEQDIQELEDLNGFAEPIMQQSVIVGHSEASKEIGDSKKEDDGNVSEAAGEVTSCDPIDEERTTSVTQENNDVEDSQNFVEAAEPHESNSRERIKDIDVDVQLTTIEEPIAPNNADILSLPEEGGSVDQVTEAEFTSQFRNSNGDINCSDMVHPETMQNPSNTTEEAITALFCGTDCFLHDIEGDNDKMEVLVPEELSLCKKTLLKDVVAYSEGKDDQDLANMEQNLVELAENEEGCQSKNDDSAPHDFRETSVLDSSNNERSATEMSQEREIDDIKDSLDTAAASHVVNAEIFAGNIENESSACSLSCVGLTPLKPTIVLEDQEVNDSSTQHVCQTGTLELHTTKYGEISDGGILTRRDSECDASVRKLCCEGRVEEAVMTLEKDPEVEPCIGNASAATDEENMDTGRDKNLDTHTAAPESSLFVDVGISCDQHTSLEDRDESEQGVKLNNPLGTPVTSTHSNEEKTSSHDIAMSFDKDNKKVQEERFNQKESQEMVGEKESENQNKKNMPTTGKENIDESSNESEQECQLNLLFASPASKNPCEGEPSSFEKMANAAMSLDKTMSKVGSRNISAGEPQEIVGGKATECERSIHKGNVMPTADEEINDEGEHERLHEDDFKILTSTLVNDETDKESESYGSEEMAGVALVVDNTNSKVGDGMFSHLDFREVLRSEKTFDWDRNESWQDDQHMFAKQGNSPSFFGCGKVLSTTCEETGGKVNEQERSTDGVSHERWHDDELKNLFATPVCDKTVNEDGNVSFNQWDTREMPSGGETFDWDSNESWHDEELKTMFATPVNSSSCPKEEATSHREKEIADQAMSVERICSKVGSQGMASLKECEHETPLHRSNALMPRSDDITKEEGSNEAKCIEQTSVRTDATFLRIICEDNEAFEEKMSEELIKTASKCIEGVEIMEENKIAVMSPGSLGPLAALFDHGHESAERNISTSASLEGSPFEEGTIYDDNSVEISKEKLHSAVKEADLHNEDTKDVTVEVNNEAILKNTETEFCESGDHKVVVGPEMDLGTSTDSEKIRDRDGEEHFVQNSANFEGAMQQVDEVDFEGQGKEIVLEQGDLSSDKNISGDCEVEISTKTSVDVAGAMLHCDKAKIGDFDGQKDIGVVKSSFAEEKRDVSYQLQDSPQRSVNQLENDEVVKIDNFSQSRVPYPEEEEQEPKQFGDLSVHAQGDDELNEFKGETEEVQEPNEFEGLNVHAQGLERTEVIQDGFNEFHEDKEEEQEPHEYDGGLSVDAQEKEMTEVPDNDFNEFKGDIANAPATDMPKPFPEAVEKEKEVDAMRDRDESSPANQGFFMGDEAKISEVGPKEQLVVNNGSRIEESAFVGDIITQEPNMPLCDNEISITTEGTGTLEAAQRSTQNSNDLVPSAGESNESAESGATEFNIDSHMFSNWETNLFAGGHGEGDEVEKSNATASPTNFIHGDSTDAGELKDEELLSEVSKRSGLTSAASEEPEVQNEDYKPLSGDKCEESSEEIADPSLAFPDLAAEGVAAEEVKMGGSVQRENPAAKSEEVTSPSAKKFYSTTMKMKTVRTNLIRGTPNKLFVTADMKENAQSFKREPHTETLTAAKAVTKRRALGQL